MFNSLLSDVTVPSLEADELEDLLKYLKQVPQVDLTGYKRPSLLRRTEVRMQRVGIERYQDYFDYLQQQPDEVTHLLDAIFINFTGFFRDRSVWDCLAEQIIPQIITSKKPHQPIRVWSAGCATGEETYSLAILLAEALGKDQFQQRVQIYGTDIDSDAVRQAQRGCYSPTAVEEIAPEILERYFEHTPDGYCWRRELRHPIAFHSHNLIQTPHLPDIDLLVCRNTLMYFTPKTQLKALVRFHFSLRQNGFLLLGKAENLVTYPQTSLFIPVYRQARIFTKVLDVCWSAAY